MTFERNKIYVFNKSKELIAVFYGDSRGLNPNHGRNLMVNPTIHIEQNGTSTFSFSMMALSEKWEIIKNPENLYFVNDRWYSPLNENSYQYSGESNARTVTVEAVETWYLLARQYHQVYNCGIYCKAKATFQGYTTDGILVRINSSDCTNVGDTIRPTLAWNQVKLWQPKDKKGNELTYAILSGTDEKPIGWKDYPSSVAMSSFSVYGNYATAILKARAITERSQNYDYVSGGTYEVESRPYPSTIKDVYVNTTVTTDTTSGNKTTRRIVTSTKKSGYSYNSSTGKFSITYRPASNEEINYVIGVYDYYDMGEISLGATFYLGYGAEVVDEHTFLVLPKADTKYKLTIDGVEYDDSQVKDSRGVIMPRGSAGYAMWAALKNTGWNLGICDVLAKGFNPSIDYGCFNVESDMKDTLYNIQCIQELYGGILDFDSNKKILNYRADATSLNSNDYQIYNDGFNQWTGYEFREGKNITDQPSVIVDNNIITKGYVLGYGNLNIKKVNGGKSYVTDFSYTNDVYEDYLEQPLIYDTNDEGGQRQLLYWGQQEIKKKSHPRTTITYQVTDIRTVEGYEHEVFDINDICRAYYRDAETGKEVYEEKRVILWEYRVFAPWDCSVELGEKTANMSELFKLIYNSAVENSPKVNASGKISSDEIVIEIDASKFGITDVDYPNYSGSSSSLGYGGYGSGFGGIGNSLTDYISLIAQKTTENSDAVAGLVIQATDLYSQVDLFATYQKRTDEMISDTYSGLRLYADELGSSLKLEVEGKYQGINKKIDDNYNFLYSYSKAGFESQESWNQSMSHQYAFIEGEVKNVKTGQTELYQQYSGLKTQVVLGEKSVAELRTDFTAQIKDANGKITETIKSFNSYKQEANKNFAKTSDLSVYAKTSYVNGELQKKVSTAEISKYVADGIANAGISVKLNNIGANFVANATTGYGYSAMRATTNNTGASILVYANGNVSINGSKTCSFNIGTTFNSAATFNSSVYTNSLSVKGYFVKWVRIQTMLYGTTNTIGVYVLSR